MNDNPKNNVLMSDDIRQKRPTILKYLDAYICHFCLISSDIKMLFFGLSFILYRCDKIIYKRKSNKYLSNGY